MSSTIASPGGRRHSEKRLDASARGPHTRDLMAKIDALEREVGALPRKVRKTRSDGVRTRPPPKALLSGIFGLMGVLILALIVAQAWLHFDKKGPELRLRAAAVRAAAVPSAPSAALAVAPAAEIPAAIETPPASDGASVVETPPAAETGDDAARDVRRIERRRLVRERARREAEAAQQAEAAQRAEAEARRQAEQARLDQARRAPEAAPPAVEQRAAGPASPEQACADRTNFISRSLCESAACRESQWRDLPSCVRRREAEERNRNPFYAGG